MKTKENAKSERPAISRVKEEAKRKAQAKAKKNAKRQRTDAIQTGWHVKARQARLRTHAGAAFDADADVSASPSKKRLVAAKTYSTAAFAN
jgi:hypothetical protein